MNSLFFGISIYALGITGITPGSTVGLQVPQLPCVASVYETACPSTADKLLGDDGTAARIHVPLAANRKAAAHD